jgi:hypothetical protein
MGPLGRAWQIARTETPTTTSRPPARNAELSWRPPSDLGAAAGPGPADLGRALLLTHAGVDNQHRTGQNRNHLNEPPNQATRPRSWRVRATVLSVGAMPIVPFGCSSPSSTPRGARSGARWALHGCCAGPPALCCAGQAPRSARPLRAVLRAGQRATASPAIALTRCRPLSAPLSDRKLMSELPAANSP